MHDCFSDNVDVSSLVDGEVLDVGERVLEGDDSPFAGAHQSGLKRFGRVLIGSEILETIPPRL